MGSHGEDRSFNINNIYITASQNFQNLETIFFMKWELVTIGRNVKFPERINTRYYTFQNKPVYKVGDKINIGDYIVEVILVRKVK